jgi:hypothetical protein
MPRAILGNSSVRTLSYKGPCVSVALSGAVVKNVAPKRTAKKIELPVVVHGDEQKQRDRAEKIGRDEGPPGADSVGERAGREDAGDVRGGQETHRVGRDRRRESEVGGERREVGCEKKVREPAAHQGDRHAPEGTGREGGPPVETPGGVRGRRRGRAPRRGSGRFAEPRGDHGEEDQENRRQDDMRPPPAHGGGEVGRHLGEDELPQREPGRGDGQREAALTGEPAAHVDGDGEDAGARVSDGGDDAVEEDQVPGMLAQADEPRAQGHERHGRQDHAPGADAVDQGTQERAPGR